MRLRRIEAVRYGALAGTTLGDLADGLTVVHGPNEAGKSSYTSLVRHVLYRYPTGRDSEPGYGVGGDGRCARLVFEDAGGRWAIERTEGPHGGKVTVKALAGPDRADLLQEMTRGVSELAFRTVFGFGLGEMAAIEEQRGSGDSVIARLSAASAGLRVSPQEVRAAVDREAADLFKATGRKPPVNALISQVRAVRADLRRLRSEADLFMADRERLNGLEAELETARTLRDAARERSTGLAVAVERAEEKLAIISAQEETLRSLRRERRGIEEEIAGVVVDEPLLAAAPDLEAIIEEAAGHTSALRGLPDLDASRTKAETRAADATARTGLEPGALEKFEDIHKDAAEVEEAREDLQRLQLQVEARDDAARKAEGLRAEAEAAVARLTDQMRLAGDPEAALAERLAALDALESARAGERAPGRGTVDAPALVLLAAGLVAVVGGVVLRQWITVGIGAVLVIAGAALTLRSRSAGASASGEQGGAYLDLLGLEKDAGPLEISRTRRSLEAARGAVQTARNAVRDADDARRGVGLTRDALETRRSLWVAWLASHGLDTSITPVAALSLLALIREAQSARVLSADARDALDRAVEQLEQFAARLVAVARPYVPVPEEANRDDVPALANRLKDALGSAREASARRGELVRALSATDVRLTAESERETRAREELLEVLVRFDLAEQGSHEDLLVLRATAARQEQEATAAYDELAQTKHQLEGRLESGARERRVGELHVEEAGLAERLEEAVDRYLVLAVASRLLAETQDHYQRERQPEVVKRASRLFSTMTEGRYAGLSVPLGEGRIEVFDTRSGSRTSDLLSRGTAEQLYLAIRLGLIGTLGEVGQGLPVLMDDVLVNFDPVRRTGAAEAIAELASERQVVFFTCHPDTADLFAEVAPGHARLEIPRLGC